MFSEAARAEGRSVACSVNIGGATVNYRNTAAAISFPNGLTTRPPVMSAHPERGLIFEYSAMGVPVVNLIDVRGLALKSGLPLDPIPFPPVGEGGVYHVRGRSRATAAVALAGGAALLVIGVWLTKRSSGNDSVLSQQPALFPLTSCARNQLLDRQVGDGAGISMLTNQICTQFAALAGVRSCAS